MSKPGPIERLDNLEDEVAVMDSRLDARTTKLQAEVKELRERVSKNG